MGLSTDEISPEKKNNLSHVDILRKANWAVLFSSHLLYIFENQKQVPECQALKYQLCKLFLT